jgi:DNA-binding transcriptional regulator YdaS (Cro superfamily)
MNINEYVEQNRTRFKTVRATAAHIGISEGALKNFLRGARVPSAKMIGKIADATGGEVQPSSWFEKRTVNGE